MLQLCFDPEFLEPENGKPVPVEWIDSPDYPMPLFENEESAMKHLAKHWVHDLEAFCYVLVEVEDERT